jgi:hypothetical protein
MGGAGGLSLSLPGPGPQRQQKGARMADHAGCEKNPETNIRARFCGVALGGATSFTNLEG